MARGHEKATFLLPLLPREPQQIRRVAKLLVPRLDNAAGAKKSRSTTSKSKSTKRNVQKHNDHHVDKKLDDDSNSSSSSSSSTEEAGKRHNVTFVEQRASKDVDAEAQMMELLEKRGYEASHFVVRVRKRFFLGFSKI